MVYDNSIDEKWQDSWEKDKIFQANIDNQKEKFFLTAAFPYPNSPQHIGHGRTYTITDIYARYKRLLKKNVLFPMGFHITGTPIIAMAKKIEKKDPALLDIFENIYGINKEQASKLTNPKELVTYFSKEIEKGMKEMGFSIDWRRKFYTYDLIFNKFIEWQFHKLKEKGYLIKGTHQVSWCSECNGAVSAHDTKGDIDPQIEEVTGIFFKTNIGDILITTYRPETVYGVTNLFINKEKKYAKYVFKNKNQERQIILSKKSYELLKIQFDLKKIQDIDSNKLLNEIAINPITLEKIPILHANFVEEEVGTGLVMSVPAHAPYDYIALKELGYLEKINLKPIIETKKYNFFPTKQICQELDVTSLNDPTLKLATKKLYKEEANFGKMIVKDYYDFSVKNAKEKIKEKLIETKNAINLFVLANAPIYCRCGNICSVKLVKDQWFIDYKNKYLKEKSKEHFNKMNILPKNIIQDYYYTIDWLNEKACTRNIGLGTKFPFDKTKVIEALSDSTIYMAFYTFSHILKEKTKNMSDEQIEELLSVDFFDNLFLNENQKNNDNLEKEKLLKELKENFNYWYPLDSSHSAMDLVHNHLVLFIFNHIAIFKEEYWPKQIITNGFVLMDGKKMSKSLGNIFPLRKAIKKYGADVIRLGIVFGANLAADTDFNESSISGIIQRFEFIEKQIKKLEEKDKIQKNENVDDWLLLKLNEMIIFSKENYENLSIRKITQKLFFEFIQDIQWYNKRKNNIPNLEIYRKVFENWTILISPLIPHFSQECFFNLKEKTYIENTKYVCQNTFPDLNKIQKNEKKIILKEKYLFDLTEDIKNILKLINEKKEKITFYVANQIKRDIYVDLIKNKNPKKTIQTFINKVEKDKKQLVSKTTMRFAKNLMVLEELGLSREEEYELLLNSKSFIEREFSLKVIINYEENSEEKHKNKALNAMPMKPSMMVE